MFLQCSPFTCLLFTNDPIRIWSRCVRKWFPFPIHAGLLTIIRKRLQGKKFTSSIHSKRYFWLTGGFKNTRLKWQILPLVWVVQRQYAFSFGGLRPLKPWPGTLPLDPAGAPPPDPCYRLALRARHESFSRLLSTPLFSTWRLPCLELGSSEVSMWTWLSSLWRVARTLLNS